MSDVYSSFKIAFHREKLEQLKRGELPTPIFAQIDWCNRCNLDCSFCFYKVTKLSDWDKTLIIDTEDGMRLLEELKEMDVKALEHTGGGSVEMHPYWKELLLHAKELGFEQALVTNGTLLDDEGLKIIKDFEWVRFSVDAVSVAIYKKIKGKDLLDRVIRNLKRLLEIKSDNNVIGFSFVVCRENYLEILDATKLAKMLGCDNIRFSLAMTPQKEKLFEGIWEDIQSQLSAAKKLEDKKFKVFSFSNRIYELAGMSLSDYCAHHHFSAIISPSGVYPCCRLKDNGRFNFGRIQDHSFKDIWFGEKRKKFIESIKNGCPFGCWMTEKNKFAEYLLKENPRHVNFV